MALVLYPPSFEGPPRPPVHFQFTFLSTLSLPDSLLKTHTFLSSPYIFVLDLYLLPSKHFQLYYYQHSLLLFPYRLSIHLCTDNTLLHCTYIYYWPIQIFIATLSPHDDRTAAQQVWALKTRAQNRPRVIISTWVGIG